MQRVAVIGCPGAGKSIFSRRLHEATRLPVVYLDSIYHSLDYDYKVDTTAWQRKIAHLVEQDRWITDGDFVNTFDIRFPRADTIIFLDFPTKVSLTRAVIRRATYRQHPRLEMPKGWKEKLSFEFLVYIITYRKNERPKVYASLSRWGNHINVIILNSPNEAEAYLKKIEAP